MSLPQIYIFLDKDRQRLGYCYSNLFATRHARDEESLKRESIRALDKYIGFALEGEIEREKIEKIAFVQIANTNPISVEDVFAYAQQNKTLWADEIEVIAKLMQKSLRKNPKP